MKIRSKISSNSIFSLFSWLSIAILLYTLILPVSQLQTQQLMTSQIRSMGGVSGVAEGQLPSVPYALFPTAPPHLIVVRKKYMFPLDPSRSLSQRTVCVKIHEMFQNTA